VKSLLAALEYYSNLLGAGRMVLALSCTLPQLPINVLVTNANCQFDRCVYKNSLQVLHRVEVVTVHLPQTKSFIKHTLAT